MIKAGIVTASRPQCPIYNVIYTRAVESTMGRRPANNNIKPTVCFNAVILEELPNGKRWLADQFHRQAE